MKNIFIHSILLKLSLLLIHAQQNIGISMGNSDQFDIYYSIDNGITATPLRDNWDISFQINSNFGNMRINSGEGIILYKIDSSIHDFENINGIDPSFVRYRNSNTKWEDGAFIVDGEILNNDLYILISGNNIVNPHISLLKLSICFSRLNVFILLIKIFRLLLICSIALLICIKLLE